MTDFYDFTIAMPGGKDQDLSAYKGKVVLVVNTASKCGFTPQYEGLESLYQKYKDDGLVILGFPCNQFGGQEPGSDDDIGAFCMTEFSVSFPIASKIDVNGDGADPLWKFLKKQQSGLLGSQAIKWNFTKFLIDKNGKVKRRYGSVIKPEQLDRDVAKLLAA